MGFVERPFRSLVTSLIPTAAYAVLVTITAFYHEPWADEAQSWLLARDSSLFLLWTRLLHYEGTPGLWHSLLWLLTRVGLPYSALNYVSAVSGTVAAYLVFRHAPFVLPIRLALPFTYFLAYQYSVIARSYCLIPPLLFGLAALHSQRYRRPLVYAVLLAALALTTVHGLLLSILIGLATFRHRAIALSLAASGIGAWSAWPAADVTFVRHFNYSWAHFEQTVNRVLTEGFSGYALLSLALIAASAPFLARGRTLAFFALAGAALISLAAVVYGQVWHFGLFFLAWVFAFWLAALRSRPGALATAALAVALVIQCFWTARSVDWEIRTVYSGARDAARFIRQHGIAQSGELYGVGYASVGVQPYFPQNVFLNFDHSYWDWSANNQMIRNYDKLPESRPLWVLVGFKTDQENYLWNSQVRRSGYRKVKHFEGNLIWQDEQFEPESFDLYQRQ